MTTATSNQRLIVLLRHGETELNVEKRFRGRANPALTADLLEQISDDTLDVASSNSSALANHPSSMPFSARSTTMKADIEAYLSSFSVGLRLAAQAWVDIELARRELGGAT